MIKKINAAIFCIILLAPVAFAVNHVPALESTLSVLSGIAKILDKDKNSLDYFRLVITTTGPYWPEIESKIHFDSPDDLHGFGGFCDDLQKMCQVPKHAVCKE